MKFSNLKKQRGAVLAFSLVMLLLLTLAGTRMIQQNKQQLEMSNNARQLTQEFANAEGLLEEAKNIINSDAAHFDVTGLDVYASEHQCTPYKPDYKQNTLLAGTALFVGTLLEGKVTITAVTCKSYDGTTQLCSSYGGSKITCNTNADCKTIPDAIAAFSGTGDICYQAYDPQGDFYSTYTKGKCPKEIYNIQVISTNASGTTRQIVSDYVVNCGS